MNNNINKKRDRDIFDNYNNIYSSSNNNNNNNNNKSNSSNSNKKSNNNNSNNNNNNNNSNNNNNINNDSTIQLNPLLFNDILPLILYDCKFQRLLDLSLISKSVFKLVQFYVSFKQNQIKFYPTISSLLKYMESSVNGERSGSVSGNIDGDDVGKDEDGAGSDSDDESEDSDSEDVNQDSEDANQDSGSEDEKEKVFYEESCCGDSDSEDEKEKEKEIGDEYSSDISDEEVAINQFNSNDSIGSDINKFNLIKFNLVSKLYLKEYLRGYDKREGKIKPKKDQLIKYCGSSLKKVYIVDYCPLDDITDTDPTCGGFYQFNKVYTHWDTENPPCSNLQDDEEYERSEDHAKYSFEYLRRVKAKKFKFTTSPNDMDLHIHTLDNILKCKSLEAIKFGYHNTANDRFIVRALSSKSPQLKELTIRPLSIKSVTNALDKSNNNTLRKLVIRDQVECNSTRHSRNPKLLLDKLIGNTSIQVLGLEVYDLLKESKYKSLSTLIQIPNIQEIRCNLHSTIPFLLHCMENPNIKVLQIKNNQYDCNDSRDDNEEDRQRYKKLLPKITELFSKFITENQSLETIKITSCFGLYNTLVGILNNNNNNNNNKKCNLQIIKLVD